jgi:hypothetical protein
VGETELGNILRNRQFELDQELAGAQFELDRREAASRRAEADNERARQLQRQREEEAQQAMDDLIQSGRELGATLGDAFFQAASGAATVRQIMADLLQQLARAVSGRAFESLGEFVASGFTQTQASQNASPTASGWERVP